MRKVSTEAVECITKTRHAKLIGTTTLSPGSHGKCANFDRTDHQTRALRQHGAHSQSARCRTNKPVNQAASQHWQSRTQAAFEHHWYPSGKRRARAHASALCSVAGSAAVGEERSAKSGCTWQDQSLYVDPGTVQVNLRMAVPTVATERRIQEPACRPRHPRGQLPVATPPFASTHARSRLRPRPLPRRRLPSAPGPLWPAPRERECGLCPPPQLHVPRGSFRDIVIHRPLGDWRCGAQFCRGAWRPFRVVVGVHTAADVLPPDAVRSRCGSCRACWSACPPEWTCPTLGRRSSSLSSLAGRPAQPRRPHPDKGHAFTRAKPNSSAVSPTQAPERARRQPMDRGSSAARMMSPERRHKQRIRRVGPCAGAPDDASQTDQARPDMDPMVCRSAARRGRRLQLHLCRGMMRATDERPISLPQASPAGLRTEQRLQRRSQLRQRRSAGPGLGKAQLGS